MEKRYFGRPERTPRGGFVVGVVTGSKRLRPLNPRNDLWNHSPDGFAWGYAGSGPAQLALALAADVLGDDQRAVAVHQGLKFALVARWDQDQPWTLTERELRDKILEVEMERARGREPQPPAVPPGASSPL